MTDVYVPPSVACQILGYSSDRRLRYAAARGLVRRDNPAFFQAP